MGGRGAASGISNNGKKYGTEFSSLIKESNIKFVKYNEAKSTKTPQETMTNGRVYATVNAQNVVTAITYYDNKGKRKKTIDLTHEHHGMQPHTHHGYNHNEKDSVKGAAKLTIEEKRMVDRVIKIWNTHKQK